VIGERILRWTAKKPEVAKRDPAAHEWSSKNALGLLRKAYPDFLSLIKDKDVLDYGCGYGHQTVALAAAGARSSTGFDPSPYALERAQELAQHHGTPVRLVSSLDGLDNAFDVVISQNSFEHFSNPVIELERMIALARPGGSVLVTFGPPWRSPWGAHMRFWCPIPWIQNAPLSWIFPESSVMRVRGEFRDNAGGVKDTYRSVGLNLMTVEKFDQILRRTGMPVVYREDGCVWGMRHLARIPVVREWFVNHISVIIRKPVEAVGGSPGVEARESGGLTV